MPLTMVRRPRSPRVLHELVISEVDMAYDALADTSVAILYKDVEKWDHKPEFKTRVHVGRTVWKFTVYWDRRTKAGKIYGWVDEGTAERGGKGEAYDIIPRNKKALAFDVPHYPKTIPDVAGGVPGIVVVQGKKKQAHVIAKKVKHRGIRPRRFTASLREILMQRTRIGGFRSVTEAAIKRGVRKIGKMR